LAIGFKFNFSRLRPFLHLLPIGIIGLITLPGADFAQMRLQYKIRGQISPGETPQKVRVLSLNRSSATNEKVALLNALSPKVKCINLSSSVFVQKCKKVNLDQKPDEISFVELVHQEFFYLDHEQHKDKEFESLFYYGKLDVFNPTPLSLITKSEIDSLADNSIVILVEDNRQEGERWASPFGFLTTQELALTAIYNHILGDSFHPQPRYAVFLITLISILVVGSLTYSYPLTLAIALTATLYAFLLVTTLVLFERYGYQVSLFAPTLGAFLSYLVSISDQLNQKRRTEYNQNRKKKQASELDLMRQNFLSLVSHDLKTPLAKIQALMEKLLSGDLGTLEPKQKEALTSVVSANGHLQKTISTLFLLNRIESNQIKIQLAPNDLQETLRKSVENQIIQANEVSTSISTELEPMFLANFDADLIGEVADNLISNAIKYSPAGTSIVVRCGDDDNALELSPPQPAIWFEVQDQGPGIPPEDRKRVLEKFQRGAKEATSKGQSVKGTGLGLYLSKYFVEEHQGRLVVISKQCDETLRPPASDYFAPDESGTVIRVVIPTESS
jgi:signal transduction histidine kinase